MKKIIFALFSFVILLSACEGHENDSKYRSMYPLIEDMVFTSTVTGTNTIVAGEPFVATVKQSQIGRLLYKATYDWSDANQVGTHRPFPKTVVYDDAPINPTDTIVLPHAGRQQIKLEATYHISGGYDASAVKIEQIPDGEVKYQVPSWQYYKIIVTKFVHVKEAE
jgi:hypothetical protein